MNNYERIVLKDCINIAVFTLVASVGTAIALLSFVISVFWNFVFPPVLGPLLQGVAVFLVILGARMIVKEDDKYNGVYTIIGVLIAVVAFVIAAKELKISLIGLKGYMAVGLCVIALLSVVLATLGRVSRKPVRIMSGVLTMICGMIVPAWFAAFFTRDLL